MPAPQPPDLVPKSALPGALAPTLVGFSGGLDSTVLLHALAAIPAVRTAGLRAVHVHHGLQPGADRWARHCQARCAALEVPLEVARVQVPRDSGLGLEGAARSARLAAFAARMVAGDILVTAHHQDDQAETFLMRALRGSGVDGLGGMREWSGFAPGLQWRPLLRWPRAALLDYASWHGLEWDEDPGNAGAVQDRDFLRNRVMPLLRQRWPHAGAAFAGSAALAGQARSLLEVEDMAALAHCATADPRVLSATALQSLGTARRARVLRRWIAGVGLPPLPAAGVARIESDLLPARADARALFEWSGARISRWRDLLHAGIAVPALDPGWGVAWSGHDSLALPGGGELVLHGAPALPWPMRVHARRGGERIQLPGRSHRHSLKRVLQSIGMPPWERAVVPLLSDAHGELQAAGDRVYAEPLDAWLGQHGARLAWRHAA